MIKKRYKMLILALISLIIMSNKCYAKIGYGVPNYSIGSGGSSGSGQKQPHDKVEGWQPPGASSDYVYNCEYDYNIYSSSSLEIDMLNNQNESILSKKNGKIIFSDEIKAGTATKVNVTETKSIWYTIGTITATYRKKGTEKVCNSYYDSCKYQLCITNGAMAGTCYSVTQCNTSYSNCKKTCTSKCGNYREEKYPELPVNSSQYNDCKNKAEKEMKERINASLTSSYTVKIQNPNYIDAGLPNTDASNQKRTVYEITSASSDCKTQGNGKTCIFTYSPKAICINAKTGIVTYRNNNTCSDDEIEIKKETITGQKYWSYFTPLDTKEGSTFSFSMVRSSQDDIQPVDFCKTLMEQEPDEYATFIKTAKDLPLTGNYNRDLLTIKGNNGVNAGCILSTDLKIPTVQKFYNEVEKKDGSTYFNGFNFYYKPIDINNPFPNGLASTSLWNDWNKSTTKKPNLSKSFEKTTYTTQINEKTIRAYNEDNTYTSWDNMYLDGRSSFIESKGIITRKADKNSFYKLGCGPYNQNWKECKKS